MTLKNKSELIFENEVVDYLCNIGGVKQWKYRDGIKTTEALWDNFKIILEKNNQSRLTDPLSKNEFNQIKRIISNLNTPYKAGQFLYGINGVSEILVELDNGQSVYLTVFDQDQVGAGDTVYEIVNQIERPKVVDGKQNRRFDITLLINGLPIIQIELKKAMRSANEALNQMEQYIAERQYSDIFSTIQILVAMTPHEIRYMANSTLNMFNKVFAFQWQDEKTSHPVVSWKEFSDKVLSIPMAHELATRYMVLDGTRNKESIKVMRPYQVYATKRVLDKVRSFDFNYDDGKLGYIWHTTGSGKTITSFKTAWLASRMNKVDKVIFLVDRIALTNQTSDAYKAYDPSGGGIVDDTASINDLHKKFKTRSSQNIIVTSIQKMSGLVGRKSFKHNGQNIIFIVDEAHRSTGDGQDSTGMLERIRVAIPNSGWVGYSGTPRFPETYEIFGNLLHGYTIKEAIADRNVLGFKVEFKETIQPPQNPTEEDLDDNIKASAYDLKHEHVELVVQDILKNWDSRSNNRMYNAMLTVRLGGSKTSRPRVMEYYDEFHKQMKNLPEDQKLRIGVSFSMVTSNVKYQREANEDLHRVIKDYNTMFNKNYDMGTIKEYLEDLTSRLNKTALDRNYLDLVVVIDQLLTGFDAPELNTLYVDRSLRGSNLIQAYSRTNRLHHADKKPWGNVVNYRWPEQNELEMNKSFAIYSNIDSANIQLTLEELEDGNKRDGILAQDYYALVDDLSDLVFTVREATSDFIYVPHSENAQEVLYNDLKKYNQLINKIKQYPYDDNTETGYPKDDLDKFYQSIGITEEEEVRLTTNIRHELIDRLATNENIDLSNIDLEMEHITEIVINYDYLIELIAQMANEVSDNQMSTAEKTHILIHNELNKLENDIERTRLQRFIDKIFNKEYAFDDYPVENDYSKITEALEESEKETDFKDITKFIYQWGIGNAINPNQLYTLIKKHKKGRNDLNNQGDVERILKLVKDDYDKFAIDEYAKLSWIRYRNQFREAIFELAEKIKEIE